MQIIKSKKKLLKIPCVLPPVFERDLLINTSAKEAHSINDCNRPRPIWLLL